MSILNWVSPPQLPQDEDIDTAWYLVSYICGYDTYYAAAYYDKEDNVFWNDYNLWLVADGVSIIAWAKITGGE